LSPVTLETAIVTVVAIVATAFITWRIAAWRQRHLVSETRRSASDLDRTKRAISRLRSERQAVLGTVREGLLVLDSRSRVIAANDVARAWFSITPGKYPSVIKAVRSADLREVIERPPSPDTDYPVNSGDRQFRVRQAPLESGRRLLAFQDRTDYERLERARREMVANVSHDLRTPLTSITLLLGALETELGAEAPASAHRHLGQLAAQVDSLRLLTDGLISLNRIESGRAPFRLQPCNLANLLEAVAASLGTLLRDKAIELRLDVPEDLVVLADVSHLERAAVNILDNARRFSPRGGTINIEATRLEDEERVRVCISDQGPGIDPSDLPRIFERFYRADRSRAGASSGLGLAIAKHVIEGHGGSVRAHNRPEGGASICFSLLLAPPPIAAADSDRWR